jgi:hypothetical protein
VKRCAAGLRTGAGVSRPHEQNASVVVASPPALERSGANEARVGRLPLFHPVVVRRMTAGKKAESLHPGERLGARVVRCPGVGGVRASRGARGIAACRDGQTSEGGA